MLKQLRKRTEGFTIIEVMIVLAIAGLIMLIVFLAVPALQRNSRNTSRRSEAGRFASAANEFMANNNGAVPTNADVATVNTIVGSVQYLTTLTIQVGAENANLPTNTIHIRTNAQCSGRNAVAGTNPRQLAIRFGLEPTNTTACINI